MMRGKKWFYHPSFHPSPLSYCQSSLHLGEKSVRPVSVVLSPHSIHLVEENLLWPPLRGSADTTNMKGQQFARKDKQKITDITQLVGDN